MRINLINKSPLNVSIWGLSTLKRGSSIELSTFGGEPYSNLVIDAVGKQQAS